MKQHTLRRIVRLLGPAVLSALTGWTALVFVAGPAVGAEVNRPNFVFILADDLGYGDLGCYGQTRIRTPNIDRLAAQGIRFTQCYAGSTVCAPSRCCLMTGFHSGHARVRGNVLVPLRPEDVTVTEVLKVGRIERFTNVLHTAHNVFLYLYIL